MTDQTDNNPSSPLPLPIIASDITGEVILRPTHLASWDEVKKSSDPSQDIKGEKLTSHDGDTANTALESYALVLFPDWGPNGLWDNRQVVEAWTKRISVCPGE